MSIARTYNAGNIYIYINNSIFASVNSMQFSIDTGKKAITGIDTINVFEYLPTQFIISGSMNCTRLKDDGGLEGRGITATQFDILMEKYITIALVDIVSEKIIYQFNNATVLGQSWQLESRNILRGSFNFKAIAFASDFQTQS